MFPSCSRNTLEEYLTNHGTVRRAVLSLSSSISHDVDDNDNNDIDLLAPIFLPSLQSLLPKLQKELSNEREKLKVDEEDIINDAMAYYKDPDFDPKKKLRIIYRGQLPAADTGGVIRQYYTQLLHSISETFFHGDVYKSPIYNCNNVGSGMMKYVGVIIVHSILQGGPGFPMFSPLVYRYLATADIEDAVQNMSFNDCSLKMKHFIEMVSQAEDVSSLDQEEVTSNLSECGLTENLTNDNKMRIIQSMIIHDVIGRPKIVLDQLREGLQTLGFGTEMMQHPDIFQELFVYDNKELSGNHIIDILDFPLSMSEDENTTKNYLKEFLKYATKVTLEQFLVFVTGAPCLPNFGLGKIIITFDNVCNFASTCLQNLTIPQTFPDKTTFLFP